MTPDMEEIRQFLYLEALLLDEWRLDEWLALYTEEALYWIPVRHGCTDPDMEVQHAYDDRKRLTERVARLNGRHAFAQQPRSMLSRMVTNVTMVGNDGPRLHMRSTFLLSELRRGVTDQWAGVYEHALVASSDGPAFRIIAKKVLLLASEEPIDNLTFLL